MSLQTDTVAAGVVVGVSGQSVKDKDPVLDNVANITFPTAPPTSYDPDDSQSIKSKLQHVLFTDDSTL